MPVGADVEKATLVHIAVKKVGNDYMLSMFPMRPGDTIAFHKLHGKPHSAERPSEVVWVGHNIPPTMKIVIQPKPGVAAMFNAPDFTLQDGVGRDTVRSGDPLRHGTWTYSVTLLDAAGATVDFIDPDVIIYPDP